MRVLMAGCGKMGSGMVKGWLRSEAAVSLTVVDPAQPLLPRAVRVLPSLDADDIADIDLLVLAVKPDMIPRLAADYVRRLNPATPVVSIAAGMTLERLEQAFGARAIIRAMPNLPVELGVGVCGLVANQHCSDMLRSDIGQLFSALGEAIWLPDEAALDSLTAISGSGPGYVFEFARIFIEAGRSVGFDEALARKLALQTMAGAVALAMESDQSLSDLRDSVTSKNGTTAAGLSALSGNGAFEQRILAAAQAARARAVEMH